MLINFHVKFLKAVKVAARHKPYLQELQLERNDILTFVPQVGQWFVFANKDGVLHELQARTVKWVFPGSYFEVMERADDIATDGPFLGEYPTAQACQAAINKCGWVLLSPTKEGLERFFVIEVGHVRGPEHGQG
jgi:hypothetical protein